jgi:hypothetical protein
MKVRKLKKGWTTLGKRCKSFEWHCIVCESYKFLDLRGRFPNSFDEVYEWAQPFRDEYDAAPERAIEVWYRQKDIATRFGKRTSR